jgi:hypothetical protein
MTLLPNLLELPAIWLKRILLALGICLSVQLYAQEKTTEAENPIYQLQGEYQKGEQGVQVAAMGEDEFIATLYSGGLPGAGWNRSDPQVISKIS